MKARKTVFKDTGKRSFVTYRKFSTARSGEDKDTLYATDSENCDCGTGTITCGLGYELFTNCTGGSYLPSATLTEAKRVCAVPYYEEDATTLSFRLYVWAKNYNIHVYDKKLAAYRKAFTFVTDAFPVVGENDTTGLELALYCSAGVWTDTGKRPSTTRTMAGCSFAHRVFYAIHPQKLIYSAALNSADFTGTEKEGGWIDLGLEGGGVIGLIPFAGDLYIFRSNGIWKLKANGATPDFELKKLTYGEGRIYSKSVAVCGENIFFYAANGLIKFDGNHFERVCEDMEILPNVKSDEFRGCYAEGKYILQYLDTEGVKRSLTVAPDGKSAYFGFYKHGLYEFHGNSLFIESMSVNCLSKYGSLPSGKKYYFQTATGFGISGRKTLRNIRLNGRGSCVLTVGNGKESKTFSYNLTDGSSAFDVRMKGESFSLSIELSMDSEIDGLTAEVYAL